MGYVCGKFNYVNNIVIVVKYWVVRGLNLKCLILFINVFKFIWVCIVLFEVCLEVGVFGGFSVFSFNKYFVMLFLNFFECIFGCG